MEKLTTEQIMAYVTDQENTEEYARISMYSKYYQAENPVLTKKVKDRQFRGKTPNNYLPTAYYTSVVDSMAGYLFNHVQYKTGDSYREALNNILVKNKQQVKDMKAGIQGLAYNMAVELVYTDEDLNPKFTNVNPKTIIPIYTDDIEPVLFCVIWVRSKGEGVKIVDVIYADLWQYYQIERGTISIRDEERQLFFSECPAVIYNTQIIGKKPPFHQIVPYIDALDWLISGNSNEIERLVDALLVVGNTIKDKDLEHMDEWKALQNIKTDMRAEYLVKDMSPAFREYVSKLLIQEIHKHAHVVDWYNPDSGIGGEASGKALKTRMFDMNMYSQRIEKIYKEATQKRMDLIGEIEKIKGTPVEPVEIVFIRDTINDFEEKIVALNQATFLSMQTKVEEAGLDWEKEKDRLDEEATDRQDRMGDLEL
jgi:SPP1 family phage portal protein